MRIRIKARPIGPLSVLPELPDARLAMLEGLNGIGKTLAVRLLQVCCTGTSPYRPRAPAWESLRKGLGEFTITATELHGAREIRWVADSRDWDVDSGNAIIPVKFREITIDGTAASLDAVRRLLAVFRLGGEEGIVETLAQQADTIAETVRRWAHRYADQNDGPLAVLEAELATSRRSLGECSSDEFRKLATGADDDHRKVLAAGKMMEEAQQRRDGLAEALDLRDRLREIRQWAPDLGARLQALDEQISDVERERERLQSRVGGLAGQLAATQPLLRELINARRTLERNRQSLSTQLKAATILASGLGIEPRAGPIRAFITELEDQAAQLNAERIELDAAPFMRTLLDQIGRELSQAQAQGLGEQIAVDDPETPVELTVRQIRTGMAVRRAFLEGKPPPPQAQEVSERLNRTNRLLTQSSQLRMVVGEVERFRRLVGQNEDRVKQALTAVNPNAAAQMQELEEQRREKDDRLLQLAAERAVLAQRLGSLGDATTELALTNQLAQVLQQAGVTEDDLERPLTVANARLQGALATLTQAQEHEAETLRELARIRGEARRARVALAKNEQLGWLRASIPDAISAFESDTTQQRLVTIDAARDLAEAVNDRLGELRGQLGAVESALRGVGRQLRSLNPQAEKYLPELQTWLGKQFSGWFNDERVRDELLPGAEGAVVVDVAAREVIWTEGGKTLARPLEAFSSGEQAFAYTRAQLAVLDEEQIKPANRLIVLDEFGAFVAHDRLAGLLGYLRDRAHKYPADQVLVMLPLSRDYDELAKTALVDDAERFSRLADQVTRQRYAIQVFE